MKINKWPFKALKEIQLHFQKCFTIAIYKKLKAAIDNSPDGKDNFQIIIYAEKNLLILIKAISKDLLLMR